MTATRRQFQKAAGTVALTGPTIVNSQNDSGTKPPVIGRVGFKYACLHERGELPANIKWQTTHGLAKSKLQPIKCD